MQREHSDLVQGAASLVAYVRLILQEAMCPCRMRVITKAEPLTLYQSVSIKPVIACAREQQHTQHTVLRCRSSQTTHWSSRSGGTATRDETRLQMPPAPGSIGRHLPFVVCRVPMWLGCGLDSSTSLQRGDFSSCFRNTQHSSASIAPCLRRQHRSVVIPNKAMEYILPLMLWREYQPP